MPPLLTDVRAIAGALVFLTTESPEPGYGTFDACFGMSGLTMMIVQYGNLYCC